MSPIIYSILMLVSRIFRAGPKSKNRALLHKDFRKPKSVVRINKDTNILIAFYHVPQLQSTFYQVKENNFPLGQRINLWLILKLSPWLSFYYLSRFMKVRNLMQKTLPKKLEIILFLCYGLAALLNEKVTPQKILYSCVIFVF